MAYHAWRVEELDAAMAVRKCGSPKVEKPTWRAEVEYGPPELLRIPWPSMIIAARRASLRFSFVSEAGGEGVAG